MEWLAGFINDCVLFINWVWSWFYTGIYDLLKSFLVVLTKASIYASLQATLFALDIAYTTVQEILADIGVIAQLQSYWNGIPTEVRNYLDFFNIPQGLMLVLSAIPTRMALRFVPFIGR